MYTIFGTKLLRWLWTRESWILENCKVSQFTTLHYRIMVPWWLQNFCRDDAYLIHDDSYSITKYHPWWLFHPWWFLFHHKISTMMYHPWCKTITKISPMMIIPSMMILIWSQNITHDDYYIHNESYLITNSTTIISNSPSKQHLHHGFHQNTTYYLLKSIPKTCDH